MLSKPTENSEWPKIQMKLLLLILLVIVASAFAQDSKLILLKPGYTLISKFATEPILTVTTPYLNDGPYTLSCVFTGMNFNALKSSTIPMRWLTTFKRTQEGPEETISADFTAVGALQAADTLQISTDAAQSFPQPEATVLIGYSIEFHFQTWENSDKIVLKDFLLNCEKSKTEYRGDALTFTNFPVLGSKDNLSLEKVTAKVYKPDDQQQFTFSWEKTAFNMNMNSLTAYLSTNSTHIAFIQQQTESKPGQVHLQPVPIKCVWTATVPATKDAKEQTITFEQTADYSEKSRVVSLHKANTNADPVIVPAAAALKLSCAGAALNFGKRPDTDKSDYSSVAEIEINVAETGDVQVVKNIDHSFLVNDQETSKPTTWLKALIVIGVVLFGAALFAVLAFFLARSRAKKEAERNSLNGESLLTGQDW